MTSVFVLKTDATKLIDAYKNTPTNVAPYLSTMIGHATVDITPNSIGVFLDDLRQLPASAPEFEFEPLPPPPSAPVKSMDTYITELTRLRDTLITTNTKVVSDIAILDNPAITDKDTIYESIKKDINAMKKILEDVQRLPPGIPSSQLEYDSKTTEIDLIFNEIKKYTKKDLDDYLTSVTTRYNESKAGGKIPVTSITLDPIGSFYIGQNIQLTHHILPINATNQAVQYASSMPNIAYVDPDHGLLTALAPGSTEISVTTQDGNKTATFPLTIVPRVRLQSIVLPKVGPLRVGDVVKLQPQFLPPGATASAPAIYVVNPPNSLKQTVTVAADGTLTAVRKGRSTVTAIVDSIAPSMITVSVDDALPGPLPPPPPLPPGGPLLPGGPPPPGGPLLPPPGGADTKTEKPSTTGKRGDLIRKMLIKDLANIPPDVVSRLVSLANMKEDIRKDDLSKTPLPNINDIESYLSQIVALSEDKRNELISEVNKKRVPSPPPSGEAPPSPEGAPPPPTEKSIDDYIAELTRLRDTLITTNTKVVSDIAIFDTSEKTKKDDIYKSIETGINAMQEILEKFKLFESEIISLPEYKRKNSKKTEIDPIFEKIREYTKEDLDEYLTSLDYKPTLSLPVTPPLVTLPPVTPPLVTPLLVTLPPVTPPLVTPPPVKSSFTLDKPNVPTETEFSLFNSFIKPPPPLTKDNAAARFTYNQKVKEYNQKVDAYRKKLKTDPCTLPDGVKTQFTASDGTKLFVNQFGIENNNPGKSSPNNWCARVKGTSGKGGFMNELRGINTGPLYNINNKIDLQGCNIGKNGCFIITGTKEHNDAIIKRLGVLGLRDARLKIGGFRKTRKRSKLTVRAPTRKSLQSLQKTSVIDTI